MFYETSEGFHFKSIDGLFAQDHIRSYVFSDTPDVLKRTDQYDGEIFSVNLPCDYSWANSSRPKVYGTAYKHMMMRMEGRIADGVYIGATPPEIISPAIENINIGIDKRTDDN